MKFRDINEHIVKLKMKCFVNAYFSYTNRCKQAEKRANRTKQRVPKKAHIVFLPTLGIILTLRKMIK